MSEKKRVKKNHNIEKKNPAEGLEERKGELLLLDQNSQNGMMKKGLSVVQTNQP